MNMLKKIFRGRANGPKEKYFYKIQSVNKIICCYDKIIKNPTNNINLSVDEKKQIKTYLKNQVLKKLWKRK